MVSLPIPNQTRELLGKWMKEKDTSKQVNKSCQSTKLLQFTSQNPNNNAHFTWQD